MSSSSQETDMKQVHLVVGTHGMWGNPGHLEQIKQTLLDTYSETTETGITLDVLIAHANREGKTYDGIDWGAERIVTEIVDHVAELEKDGSAKVIKFSIVGYSLGGLIARYVIGVLHSRDFFKAIEPVNFTTFATPHIGIPRYPGFFSKMASALGPRMLSRTGPQFFAADEFSKAGEPLLKVMADKDRVFYQALALFPNMTIYANAIHDGLVPFLSSAIEFEDPFLNHETSGIEVTFDEKYKPLITSYTVPDTPPPPPPKPFPLSPSWWKNRKPRLPPLLMFRFPFNILLYLMLPLLIPLGLSALTIWVAINANASQKRIKGFEKDPSAETKLYKILHKMEEEMENAMEETAGEVAAMSVDAAVADSAPPPTKEKAESSPSATPTIVSPGETSKSADKPCPRRIVSPVLLPAQVEMVESLNTLPNLKKRIAFIDGVINSHAPLIVRDPKRFAFHEVGRKVLQHWADNFVL